MISGLLKLEIYLKIKYKAEFKVPIFVKNFFIRKPLLFRDADACAGHKSKYDARLKVFTSK